MIPVASKLLSPETGFLQRNHVAGIGLFWFSSVVYDCDVIVLTIPIGKREMARERPHLSRSWGEFAWVETKDLGNELDLRELTQQKIGKRKIGRKNVWTKWKEKKNTYDIEFRFKSLGVQKSVLTLSRTFVWLWNQLKINAYVGVHPPSLKCRHLD